MQKTSKNNKVRPSMIGSKRIGMRDSELDKLKGLSKADQVRKMNALAHEFSFFGQKNKKKEKDQDQV